MTSHPDELTHLLTGAADDLVERERVPAPDAPRLWRRGRSTTWLARGAAAGVAGLLAVAGAAMVAVVRTSPATAPSDGASLTYPELVSDLFSEGDFADPGPVFALVTLPGSYPQASSTGVVERDGALVRLPRWSTSTTTVDVGSLGANSALAPDGVHLFTPSGIVDLTDGTLTRPLVVEGVPQVATAGRAVWSPDSQHLAASTLDGPVVLDRFADVVLRPADGGAGVMLAGWRDDATLLGVRSSATGGAAFEVVSRGLTDERWSTVSTVSADAVAAADAAGGRVSPSRAFASPGGTRLLLVDRGGASVLLDAGTGRRMPFAGAAEATAATWDQCDPVWQGDQPLLADGGLRRPGDGATVLAFSERVRAGCVTLAGEELTGTPAPGREWRERVWTVALPVFWAVALAGTLWLTVWMVIALRRSRKHGEDFLPMMLGRLF